MMLNNDTKSVTIRVILLGPFMKHWKVKNTIKHPTDAPIGKEFYIIYIRNLSYSTKDF